MQKGSNHMNAGQRRKAFHQPPLFRAAVPAHLCPHGRYLPCLRDGSDHPLLRIRALDADKDYWALRDRVRKALGMLDQPAAAAAAARILKDDKDKAPAILESVARD